MTLQPAWSPTSIAERTTDADSWFSALDQRSLTFGADSWTAFVTGIHVLGRDAWIQVECAGQSLVSGILHVTIDTTLHDALRALEALIIRESTSNACFAE